MAEKISLLNQAKQAIFDGETAQALVLCKRYINHSADYPKQLATGILVLSDAYHQIGKIEQAIDLLETAQARLLYSPEPRQLLVVQNVLAQRYSDDTRFEDAMNTWLALASEAANLGDVDHFVEGLIGIASLLEVVSDHHRALQFYHKARQHYQSITSTRLKLRINLCEVSCLIALGLYDEAQRLLTDCETETLLDAEFGEAYMAEIYLYHSQICRGTGHLEVAINLLEKAKASSDRLGFVWIGNKLNLEISHCLSLTGQSSEAIDLLQATLRSVNELSLPLLKCELYEALSCAYDVYGEYQAALECEKHAHVIAVELLSRVPVSELGQHCLRRFKRWEPKLDIEKTRLENAALKDQALSQQEVMEKLAQDASIDPLTRLYNRRWLDTTFQERVGKYAILIIDADNFKTVNDDFSHQMGDTVLQELALLLQQSIRAGDFVARYGGEEFVILLAATEVDKVVNTAERIREQVEQYHWCDIVPGRKITISIGMAIKGERDSVDSAFERADKALYQSKHDGRNRVTFA